MKATKAVADLIAENKYFMGVNNFANISLAFSVPLLINPNIMILSLFIITFTSLLVFLSTFFEVIFLKNPFFSLF